MNEPLKITVKFYNKKLITEIDHSDVSIDELHDLWLGLLQGMGYSNVTINEFYEHLEK